MHLKMTGDHHDLVQCMLIFLDTEYTDSLDIDLISIGLVSEDGTEFYAQRSDYRDEDCDSFVRAAVLPLLNAPAANILRRDEMAERLRAWFATLPSQVVIACDDYTDYSLLADALDGEFPANIALQRYDLRHLVNTAVFNRAVCQHHDLPGQPWHHALYDARALRAGWLAWTAAEESK